jgi:hypothetical protein
MFTDASSSTSSRVVFGTWTKSTEEDIRRNEISVTAVPEALMREAPPTTPEQAHVSASARSHPQDQELDATSECLLVSFLGITD